MRPLPSAFAITLVAAILLPAIPASASSDDAWAEFNQRVTRSCLAASGIKNARASTIVGFDDRAGKVAILISDRTRGSNRARLCLYDKASQTAFVDEADGWAAPPATAGR
jgi:hypothetical protein